MVNRRSLIVTQGVVVMDNLDPRSRAFLRWVEKQFDSGAIWPIRTKALERLDKFYMQEESRIKTRLLNKMIEGAKVHGAPKLAIEDIEHELDMEFLDILGWSCMAEYITKDKR